MFCYSPTQLGDLLWPLPCPPGDPQAASTEVSGSFWGGFGGHHGRAEWGLTEDGADEPHEAVELVGKAHLQEHRGHVRRLHGVAELDAEEDAAVEEQLPEGPLGVQVPEAHQLDWTRGVRGRGRRWPDALPPLGVSFEVVGPVADVPGHGPRVAGDRGPPEVLRGQGGEEGLSRRGAAHRGGHRRGSRWVLLWGKPVWGQPSPTGPPPRELICPGGSVPPAPVAPLTRPRGKGEFTRGSRRADTEPPEWSLLYGWCPWASLSHWGSPPARGDQSQREDQILQVPALKLKGTVPQTGCTGRAQQRTTKSGCHQEPRGCPQAAKVAELC